MIWAPVVLALAAGFCLGLGVASYLMEEEAENGRRGPWRS